MLKTYDKSNKVDYLIIRVFILIKTIVKYIIHNIYMKSKKLNVNNGI